MAEVKMRPPPPSRVIAKPASPNRTLPKQKQATEEIRKLQDTVDESLRTALAPPNSEYKVVTVDFIKNGTTELDQTLPHGLSSACKGARDIDTFSDVEGVDIAFSIVRKQVENAKIRDTHFRVVLFGVGVPDLLTEFTVQFMVWT